MSTTPVVLIAFNRPELVRRTLNEVRTARPDRLFLIADGPRSTTRDQGLTQAVRAELEQVDWPCTVHRRYSDLNLGCEANVELGLDWVFDQVEEAIILEDDCVPDPSFFPFATELLDRFRNDTRVWHVAGNSHWVPTELFAGDSYAFSTWASVWGWATWRRAWRAHRDDFSRTHAETRGMGRAGALVRRRAVSPAPGSLITGVARRHYEDVAASKGAEDYGWDSHWWLTIMAQGGLSATPAVNLVANDGFGEGATHTRSSRPLTASEPMTFPLIHPVDVALNETVERELELVLIRANGRLARAARWLIRPLWLRGIVRTIVSNATVWRMVRLVSRVSGRLRRQERSRALARP